MYKYIFILFLFVSCTFLDAQRYQQSYVDQNGNVCDNYYYPNMTPQPQGRPYRQNGRIMYAPVGQPNYYNNPYNRTPYRDANGYMHY